MTSRFTVAEVVRATCHVYGLDADQLKHGVELDVPARKRSVRAGRVAEARCVAGFIARRITGQSYQQIATRLDYVCHTSIVYAERRITQRIIADDALRNRVAAVIGRIVNDAAPPLPPAASTPLQGAVS